MAGLARLAELTESLLDLGLVAEGSNLCHVVRGLDEVAGDLPNLRTIGQTTPLGARLDSWADVAVYVATTASLLILWPERGREEWVPVIAVVVSFMAPAVMGLLRFGRFTSYHTILVKIAVVATVIGLFAMLLDVSVWPFRIAAALAVLAGLEELIITMILREERSNDAVRQGGRHEAGSSSLWSCRAPTSPAMALPCPDQPCSGQPAH